jgi:hypothetical protein
MTGDSIPTETGAYQENSSIKSIEFPKLGSYNNGPKLKHVF